MNTDKAINIIVNHLVFGPREYVYHYITTKGKIKEYRFDSKLTAEEIEGVLKGSYIMTEGVNHTMICSRKDAKLKKNKLLPVIRGNVLVANKNCF